MIQNKITFTSELPFTMFVGKKRVNRKKTTLYFIKKNGHLYTTELSPFPGISQDSLQSLEFQFEKALTQGSQDHKTHHNPHVSFCLFELQLKENWHKMQRSYTPQSIPVNKLISYRNDTAPQTNEHHFQAHNDMVTVKLKIDDKVDEVCTYLKENRDLLCQYKLRLDANQRLERDQLVIIYEYAQKLDLNIDYFEEPLKVAKHYQDITIPFALDENIKHHRFFPKAKSLVFKPTQHFKDDIWQLRQHKEMIISSTFDSIFTHATLLAMAQIVNEKQKSLAHGLSSSGVNDLKTGLSVNDVFPILPQACYDEFFKS